MLALKDGSVVRIRLRAAAWALLLAGSLVFPGFFLVMTLWAWQHQASPLVGTIQA